jgi:hypothetical protein
MNYSRCHKGFADNLSRNYNLNKQNVLDDPQNYLGPNYKEVLNLWFYWDSWGIEQIKVYLDRRAKLGEETRLEVRELAKKLATEVIDSRFVVFLDGRSSEIVASHLYLERNIPFTYLPLIFDL